MPIAVLLLPATVLLVSLLHFRKRESLRGVLLTKSALSALFVLAALSGPHGNPRYFALVLAGLLFCMAGDVFLVSASRRLFLAGLLAFLTGHVLYSAAFFTMAAPGLATVIAAAVCLPSGGAFFLWLRPRLGKMALPVAAYIAVISVMVAGASTLAGESELPVDGRVLALTGAVLFYLSDVFVARQRFVKPEFLNRLIGLPLYYAGQFLIAFSTLFL
ncbi:MAG TPA: lysoplasmalogenase [Syntrophales bacterium]|jgi:uncharacterized membrane protein YhhN|nr:lysoplasmalogenase [Syntrophales bacterium]